MANELVKVNAEVLDTAHINGVDILKPLKKEIYLKDIYLYNVGKRAKGGDIGTVKTGDEVVLKHEKTVYDDLMTLCYTKTGVCIGEAGEFDKEIIAHLLDAGKELSCKVVRTGFGVNESFVRLSVSMIDY